MPDVMEKSGEKENGKEVKGVIIISTPTQSQASSIEKNEGEAEGQGGNPTHWIQDPQLAFMGDSPKDRLLAQLRAPVQLTELALLYGLDYEALEKAATGPENSREQKAANMELSTLRGIQKYLMERRRKIQ